MSYDEVRSEYGEEIADQVMEILQEAAADNIKYAFRDGSVEIDEILEEVLGQ